MPTWHILDGEGCTTPSAASQFSCPRTDLCLLLEVFWQIDRAYVDTPDFSALTLGAIRGLKELMREGIFQVAESSAGLTLTYRGPGGSLERMVFSRKTSLEDAWRDLAVAYGVAREIAPGIDQSALEQAMLREALRHLDPHSTFLDRETYREMQLLQAGGPSGGVGLELVLDGGAVTVVSAIEGGPAFWVGIRPGDRILRISGTATGNLSLFGAVRQLRGEPGTTVTVTVAREEWAEPKDFTLIREQVRVQAIQSGMLEAGIGYIRLRRFSDETVKELEAVVQKFVQELGLQGLVLDLRDNTGGRLSTVVKVTEKFLEAEKVLVYTEGRDRNQNLRFRGSPKKPYVDLPLVVLVNHRTAAGSEIMAGALQDWKRGTIIGTPTAGQGLIQTSIPLSDGSVLHLTTAKWFTPEGRSVHGTGLTPDVTVKPAEGPVSGEAIGDRQRDLQVQEALAQLKVLMRSKSGQ